MIVDCIADLHGHYPELEGGDLLIVAGDLTARDTITEFEEFQDWLLMQDYKKKIVIAGNHDNSFQHSYTSQEQRKEFGTSEFSWEYLCDSGTEFEYETFETALDSTLVFTRKKKLKIWGSPWTLKFPGMNPKCMAFTCDAEEELAEKWALIPDDIDILVTHGPPQGIMDRNKRGDNCGSKALLDKSRSLNNLKLFVFGHIHEDYGLMTPKILRTVALKYSKHKTPTCASMPFICNASHVNERYQPVNKPIRIIL